MRHLELFPAAIQAFMPIKHYNGLINQSIKQAFKYCRVSYVRGVQFSRSSDFRHVHGMLNLR